MPNTKSPPIKRLGRLVTRSIRQREKGVAKFNQARATLQKAISAGLMPGVPIQVEVLDKEAGTIELQKFVLVDNFEGEKTGGWATVSRFELKKCAKNPRRAKETVEPA